MIYISGLATDAEDVLIFIQEHAIGDRHIEFMVGTFMWHASGSMYRDALLFSFSAENLTPDQLLYLGGIVNTHTIKDTKKD